jgi:hypothetical protein
MATWWLGLCWEIKSCRARQCGGNLAAIDDLFGRERDHAMKSERENTQDEEKNLPCVLLLVPAVELGPEVFRVGGWIHDSLCFMVDHMHSFSLAADPDTYGKDEPQPGECEQWGCAILS